MNLIELFSRSLAGRREVDGFEFERDGMVVERLTFGALDARAKRLASVLAARGVVPGDRVAVRLANRTEMIDVFLGCLSLGAIIVPMNILYRERECAHILTDSEPRAVVADEPLDASGVPVWHIEDLRSESDSGEERPRDHHVGDETPAAIIYTSGTTGRAKGVVLTHGAIAANAENLVRSWRFTDRDRLLLPLPLFHVHGLCNGLGVWLASGCRLRLLERFERERAAQTLLDFEPTVMFGVPTIYVRLLDTPAEAARRIGSRARLFVSGSAPLRVDTLDEFRELFGHTILERYGMTETLMTASNPLEGERRPGTVGLPLPGVSVMAVDEAGRAVPAGVRGELLVRSATMFAGYWRNESATRGAFRNGWFRTGDLAIVEQDGFITLTGRKSDLIISGGFNIDPVEIEELLRGLPGVDDVAVAGVADEARGEVPVAFIVGESFEPSTLEARCREALASFKVPRAFVRVESLPRTALGKVQRKLLGSEHARSESGR